MPPEVTSAPRWTRNRPGPVIAQPAFERPSKSVIQPGSAASPSRTITRRRGGRRRQREGKNEQNDEDGGG